MKLNFTFYLFIIISLFSIQLNGQCPDVVDAGTVTVNDDGGNNFPFVVCFGDAVDMTNNGDFILPTAGPNPQLMFALYTCPPTELDDPGIDPCYDSSFWTGSDFQTSNDGGIVTFLGQNTFWMVPIAADNGNAPPNGPNYDSDGDLCFDINIDQVQMWTFLDEITFDETNVDDCAGEAEITIEGGYEALFPGIYNCTNTGSGFLSQAGTNGEDVTITGLMDGDFYSFDVTDGNGCTASFSGGPIVQDVPMIDFDYPDICYEGSAFPDYATPAGGSFSFAFPPGDGASIDPFTGEITDALGDYDVTYTVMGDCMSEDLTITVTTLPPLPLPILNAFYEFCESDIAIVSPGGIGDFYTLYENDFTQNPLSTSLDFEMDNFINPGDGPIDFYASQTVDGCESERELFTVEILSETPPEVPLFYTVCQDEEVTIIPTSSHGAGNPTFSFYGNAALTDFLFSGEEYTFTPTMNTTIYVTELNDICETRPASVDIIIELPPTGIAGMPVCDATNAFYVVDITTNAANIISSDGLVTNNNNGTFTISDIPSGFFVDLELVSSPNNCTTELNLPVFECSCLPPAAPISGGDQRACAGDPFTTLSVTVDPGVTVDWYDAATAGNLLQSNSTTYVPLGAGTYYAEARTIADDCINDTRTPVSFTIDPVPVLSMSTTNCSADLLSYDVVLVLIDAGTVQSSVGTVSGSGANYTISNIPVGTDVSYTAFNSNMNCSLGPIVVTSPTCPCPAINEPTPSQNLMICDGDPIPSIDAMVGVDETADWYDAATGGNLLSSNSLTFTPAAAGTYFVEARNTINNCVSSRVAISITSNPNPTFVLNSSTCSADLLTYDVNIDLNNADNLASNLGTVTNIAGNNYSITGITSGTDLILTLTNSTTTCSDMFTITAPDCSCGIVNAPVNNGDVLICTGDAIPALEVSVNAGETVDWYDAPTTGTLLLANSNTFTPMVAGTYYAETRVIADDCTSSVRTAVMLTINTTPTLISTNSSCDPSLLTYQVVLQINDASTLQVNEGDIANNGNGSFTISNITTGTDFTYTAFNATATCSFGPETVTSPACPCPMVSAPIVSDTMICNGDPIPTLTAIVGTDETADWYDAMANGNLLLSNSLTYTPPSDGTYFVEARNTINNCIGARQSVTITTNPIPSFVIDNSTCSEDLLTYSVTVTIIDANEILSDVGLIIPSDIIVDNYSIFDIPVGMDLTLTVTNTTTSCTYSETIPAPDCSCGVIDPPVSEGNVSICTDELIPSLVVMSAGGELSVNWYDAPVGGNLLLEGSNSYTPTMAGFYFAETFNANDGCVSSSRTLVSLTINATPNQLLAEANCSPDLQSYTIDLQIVNAFSIGTDVGTVVDNGGGNFSLIDIPVGMDATYSAYNIDSTCIIGPFVIVAPDCSCPVLSTPSTSPDQSICAGETIEDMMVSVGVNQTADWYDADINGTQLLSESLSFTPTAAGTYFVEARDTITNCVSERVNISLEINPIPSFVVDMNTCAADLSSYTVELTVTDADAVSADQGTVVNNGGGSFSINNISAGVDVNITVENSVSTCSFSDIVLAPDCSCPMVNPPTGLMDLAICAGENTPTFTAVVTAGETVDWYDSAVDGNLIIANSLTYTPTTPGTVFAETRLIVNDCVSATRIAVAFTINENPTLSITDFTLPTCNEDNGLINLGAAGGLAPYSFNLNNGETQLESAFPNLAASNYLALVEDTNGCIDTISQNLVSPEDVFADAGEGMELSCLITAVTLDGSLSDDGLDIVYQWFDPNSLPIDGATTDMLTVQTPGIYTLEVTNTASQCSRSSEVEVTQNIVTPFVDAGLTANLSCNVSTAILTATTNNPDNLTFEWTTNQGGNIIGSTDLPSITANAEGMYYVNVIDTENGCPGVDSVLVTQIIPLDLNFGIDSRSPACFGDLDGSILVKPENPNATLLFSINDDPFTSNPLFNNLIPGSYTINVEDENGCQRDTSIVILTGRDLTLILEDDDFISLGDSILLEGMTNANLDELISIQWDNRNGLSCDTCLVTYTHNLQETTLFTLEIMDSLGCTAKDDIRITVDKRRQIFVPNAFSPNNSGSNDELTVFGGDDVKSIQSFSIFSRWGETVYELANFQPNDPDIGWDGKLNGKLLNAGVYVYVIEVEYIDGEVVVFSGDILLIR